MLKQKMVNEGNERPNGAVFCLRIMKSAFQIAAREATLDNKAENFFC